MYTPRQGIGNGIGIGDGGGGGEGVGRGRECVKNKSETMVVFNSVHVSVSHFNFSEQFVTG